MLPLDQENTITADWLVYKGNTNQLVPYVAGSNVESHAVHQWLRISSENPFPVSLSVQEGVCLFLNNQLLFVADSTAAYTLDLSEYAVGLKPIDGKYLLTVWHPEQRPAISGIRNTETVPTVVAREQDQVAYKVRVRETINLSPFILFMLLIGLLYGALKNNYPSDFSSLYNINSFLRVSSLEEGFLSKPISSWSSILFVLVFSLSLSLLIAAIHTEMHNVRLFNQIFPVSAADISTKVLFYTVLIFLFILLKYLFLKMMAFIFGLEQIVQLQYREFVRTILFLGIFMPFIVLVYLAFNASMPDLILFFSNVAVALVLIITVIRVFATVNTKAPVQNLHLFSYLCATEVIPLAIILKLIVFNF
ncbi:DUF4271 domain-containing protein [Pontibacter sp. Tf4]|uniref:DUF4271 domain-containing protein n=1 Tax=Pontibacter sp. Tf4 TaxID=2761620 RepID=UPI00351ABFD0